MNHPAAVKQNGGMGTLAPTDQQLIRRQLPNLAGLRGRLLGVAGAKPVRSLLVTSGLPGAGATTVAVTTAMALAASVEEAVVLVDANVHSPRLHEMFHLPSAHGLAEIVQGTAEVDDCLAATEVRNLQLLPAGASGRQDPQMLLGSSAFAAMVRTLAERGAWVVIDAPPMLSRPEAMMLLPHVDGVILAVACEDTKKEIPILVRERVESVGGTLLGVVLNRRKAYLPKALYRRV